MLLGIGAAAWKVGSPSVGGGSAVGRSSRSAPPTMKWEVDIAPWELDYGLQRSPVSLPSSVREGDPPQPFEVHYARPSGTLPGLVLSPGGSRT